MVHHAVIPYSNPLDHGTYANSDDYVTGWREGAVLAPAVTKAKERALLQQAIEFDADPPAARDIAARLAAMSGPFGSFTCRHTHPI